MPFKPWVRNISLLAWMLGASAVANVVTMVGVLYLALGTPKVYVKDGYIDAYVRNDVSVKVVNRIDVREPVRVQVGPPKSVRNSTTNSSAPMQMIVRRLEHDRDGAPQGTAG